MSVQEEVLALRVLWNRSRPLLEAATIAARTEEKERGRRVQGLGYTTVEHDGETFHIGWIAVERTAGEETS